MLQEFGAGQCPKDHVIHGIIACTLTPINPILVIHQEKLDFLFRLKRLESFFNIVCSIFKNRQLMNKFKVAHATRSSCLSVGFAPVTDVHITLLTLGYFLLSSTSVLVTLY